jgi:hypothetical protein
VRRDDTDLSTALTAASLIVIYQDNNVLMYTSTIL